MESLKITYAKLFGASLPIEWIIYAFVINFLIAFIVSFLLIEFVPLKITKNKKYFFYLLLSFCVFIPIVGSIAAFITVLWLKKYEKDFNPLSINVYEGVEYTRKNPAKSKVYGIGWASMRLDSKDFSLTERNRALQSIGKGAPRETNRIYNKLLSDDMEELRICAFSILEIQRDFFQKKINVLLKKLEKSKTMEKRAFFEKQLALLYWEIVYRNLSEKEFRDILLERSVHYAKSALKVMPTDYSLMILLAKIKLELEKYDQSYREFIKASEFEAPNSKILPFLAELAYRNKDYRAVKKYLTLDPTLKYIFKVNPVFQLWSK